MEAVNFFGLSKFKAGLLIPVLFCSYIAFSQDVSTKNDYTGNWDDAGSWVGGVQPDPLYNDIDGQNIYVEGYINVGAYGIDQGLTVSTNSSGFDFVIEDTLVIYGDFEFKQDAMDLIVNGFLIVFGDVTFRNKVDVLTNGEIIVKGTLSFVGAQGTYNGDGNVYADNINDTGRDNIPEDNQKTIDSLQNDYPDIYDFVENNGQTPLPVEILYFTAKNMNGGVQLSWATVNEENFDFFTIERSWDGRDFNELATVPGNPDNSRNVIAYDFFDEMPLSGYSFYRLKATDLDGFTAYHGIISVRIDNAGDLIRIYPNPIEGEWMNVNFSGKTDAQYSLFSGNGILLQQGTISQGINEIQLSRSLSSGIYFFRLESLSPMPRRIIIR